MLSDEEKKEYIEHEILDRLYCLEENDFDKNKVDDGYIKAVLNACKEAKNLIEKQSKEIEELNKSDASKEQSSMNYYILYKELVDRIQAKIEELDKEYKEAYNKGFKTDMVNRLREIKLMQSLLEKE